MSYLQRQPGNQHRLGRCCDPLGGSVAAAAIQALFFRKAQFPIHLTVTGATPAASAASHHAPGLSKKLGFHGGLTKRAAAGGGLRTLTTGSKPAGVCGMSGPAVSSASSGSLGDGGSSAAGFSKAGGISAATAGGTGGGGLMMLGGAAYRVAGLRRPGPRRCQ
jgi:hypothetical protein